MFTIARFIPGTGTYRRFVGTDSGSEFRTRAEALTFLDAGFDRKDRASLSLSVVAVGALESIAWGAA